MEQVGAADVHFLPRTRCVVLHYEDREQCEELSDGYDEEPARREKAAEFFCRVLNASVQDVILPGLFKADSEAGHRSKSSARYGAGQ